jgi:hypothetical protein
VSVRLTCILQADLDHALEHIVPPEVIFLRLATIAHLSSDVLRFSGT